MRFGVVGTGPWMRHAHLGGLRAAAGSEPVAVWGRDPAKVRGLAEQEGLAGCTDFDELLDLCDALAFAVPPDVQAPLAVQAARAGKHLLLEKPLALSAADAREVELAVRESGVATVVFVTAAFTPERRTWLAELAEQGPLRGGSVVALSSALATADNPFNTPWRREKGALWDVGPHLLTALEGALGPVSEVAAAARGAGDLVHLLLRHGSGATSTLTASIATDPRAAGAALEVWGDTGRWAMPTQLDLMTAYATAVEELLACAASGEPHAHDVRDGRRVVELLASAEALLS